ncbi:hypothetical protein MYCTH_2305379 [Thermothelomyces thermophilus ATCC 42464]|uniref:C3H1-type domain-containing protein n=1 Tax=Thermothelomyces thermophilus (strain ATCC 42464 / BCRC 31852 / DSM 1799) TaxID=573729 RepID=G2QCR5_THET4|nr:uncharacterized protein MYCTH_2305379 [Thermothelomyces thermophilus ATCC 42464]AEO58187.1 hypothetical protein MYCTH_2305379 [Thermothelomyces thermophilus ATCC 42464]
MSRDEELSEAARSYLHPLKAWLNHADERKTLEGELEKKYMELLKEYDKKCAECEYQKHLTKVLGEQHRKADQELNRLRADTESAPFAFVVIDGDGAIFREDLIALGEEGGGQAAHELHKQLKAYFHDSSSFSNIDNIFVHVVLNMKDLSRTLHDSGVLLPVNDHAALTKFARGFCRAQPLFTFTDVGHGKEQADHKVRKLFEVMERNIQCKRLVLAGCHDNGYATFLESFRGNEKICLLKTTPPAADFRKLSFSWISCPSVFRSDPLPSKRPEPVEALAAPPHDPIIPTTFNPSGDGTNNPPIRASPSATESPRPAASSPQAAESRPGPRQQTSYATVGQTAAAPVINIASQRRPASPRPYYQLNKNDERVDVPLARPDPQVVQALENRKNINGGINLCNRYHLIGHCDIPNCRHYHGERLNAAGMLALRHKVRKTRCNSGLRCRDVSCIYGHHCTNPGSCRYDIDCRFFETHGMDITPTIKVYEDGKREVIP